MKKTLTALVALIALFTWILRQAFELRKGTLRLNDLWMPETQLTMRRRQASE